MTERDPALARALDTAGLPAPERMTPLGGGCIHRVFRVELAGGDRIVAKCAAPGEYTMLVEERAGLARLAANPRVRVPVVSGPPPSRETPVLLLEYLPPVRPTNEAWALFGADLAALHAADGGARYGFPADNHLGRTPQPNEWCDDWIEFNRHRRLGPQIALAARAGRLERGEHDRLRRLVDRLDAALPAQPPPALLHGDLWSGNALPTSNAGNATVRVAMIDPACSFGDGWADIAMMRLFGGFPPACFDAYEASAGRPEGVDRRVHVYQLYHLLNHLNLFGRGYAGSVMGVVGALGG